jgi:hypothetical protein
MRDHLAHVFLANLAQRGLRQRFDDDDFLGMLEAGDAAFEQLQHLLAAQRAVGLRHHHGDHDLAPARVGPADHRGFGDVRDSISRFSISAG